jgi:hypothetical protein
MSSFGARRKARVIKVSDDDEGGAKVADNSAESGVQNEGKVPKPKTICKTLWLILGRIRSATTKTELEFGQEIISSIQFTKNIKYRS